MSEAERQKLIGDAVVNNLSTIMSAIVGLLLVPFMLKSLGQYDYGLWVVAGSLMGIILAADFGLGWSITRVVAADPAGAASGDADFVRSAANVYVLIGLGGCLVLGLAGLLSTNRSRLPPVGQDTAAVVFWLVGAVFCAERIGTSGSAVLSGLRRFYLLNVIIAIFSLVWAAGVIAVLISGGGVIAVVVCQLGVAVIKSAVMLWLAARLSPRLRFRPFFLRWAALRHHVSFALSSQMANLLGSIWSNAGPMLLGFISGPSAAVPFYIGQKLPTAVSSMSWRAAEVLFPAASASRHDNVKSAQVLQVGSRSVLVLALPLTVLMFVAAPGILRAWLGNPPPGSIAVLRILAAAVLADGVMVAPLYLLWGRGRTKPILVAYTALGAGVVALTLALVYPFGAPGVAWGMLISMAAGAVIVLVAVARECRVDAGRLITSTWRGLLLPVLACVTSASALIHAWHDSRLSAVAAAAIGLLLYAAILLLFSGSDEEKRIARAALSRSRDGALLIFRRLRGGNVRR